MIYQPHPQKMLLTPEELRNLAESKLATTAQELKSKLESSAKLIHELQVHKIELEIQNEELIRTQLALDRYLNLYEFAPVAYLTLSRQGLIQEANLISATLLGVERHGLLQRQFAGFIAETADADRWHLFFTQIIKQTQKQSIDLSLKRNHAPPFQAQLDCVPLLDEQNNPVLRMALSDITERKQVEQQLQESEQKLAATFEIVDVGIAITDEQGNVIDCNQRSEIILGISKNELLQRNFADKHWQIIRPDFSTMPPEEFANVKALKTKTKVSHVEIGLVKKEGEITWLLVTATPLQLKGYGVVITYIDITAQKQAEAVLLGERQQLLTQAIDSQEELDETKRESQKITNALDVILKHRETDPNNAKNRFSLEMDSVILPLFKKLKGMTTDKNQKLLIDLLDTQLQQLSKTYGVTEDTSSNPDYLQLTPTEMQVALLIRQGLATKTIAASLNISADTVCTHRKHIRKKLKLDGKSSSNLRSHLISLLKPTD